MDKESSLPKRQAELQPQPHRTTRYRRWFRLHQLVNYCSRNRSIGFIANARRAGIEAASNPTRAMVTATPNKTTGSLAEAWYTMLASTFDAATPSRSPVTEPTARRRTVLDSAARSTCACCAPKATRMPNSRRLLLTVYEARPNNPVSARTMASEPKTVRATVAATVGNIMKLSESCQLRRVNRGMLRST